MDIDDFLYKGDILNEIYKEQKNIYLIHYPYGFKSKLSFGTIKNISEDNNEIRHSSDTDEGSSGAPIFNLSNYKIIGVHKGNHKKYEFQVGSILKNLIISINNNNLQDFQNIPHINKMKFLDISLDDVKRNKINKLLKKVKEKTTSFENRSKYINSKSALTNNLKKIINNKNNIIIQKDKNSKANFYINNRFDNLKEIFFCHGNFKKTIDNNSISSHSENEIKNEEFIENEENDKEKESNNKNFNEKFNIHNSQINENNINNNNIEEKSNTQETLFNALIGLYDYKMNLNKALKKDKINDKEINQNEENYYLINKFWLQEFENFSNYKTIEKKLNNTKYDETKKIKEQIEEKEKGEIYDIIGGNEKYINKLLNLPLLKNNFFLLDEGEILFIDHNTYLIQKETLNELLKIFKNDLYAKKMSENLIKANAIIVNQRLYLIIKEIKINNPFYKDKIFKNILFICSFYKNKLLKTYYFISFSRKIQIADIKECEYTIKNNELQGFQNISDINKIKFLDINIEDIKRNENHKLLKIEKEITPFKNNSNYPITISKSTFTNFGDNNYISNKQEEQSNIINNNKNNTIIQKDKNSKSNFFYINNRFDNNNILSHFKNKIKNEELIKKEENDKEKESNNKNLNENMNIHNNQINENHINNNHDDKIHNNINIISNPYINNDEDNISCNIKSNNIKVINQRNDLINNKNKKMKNKNDINTKINIAGNNYISTDDNNKNKNDLNNILI